MSSKYLSTKSARLEKPGLNLRMSPALMTSSFACFSGDDIRKLVSYTSDLPFPDAFLGCGVADLVKMGFC